MPDPAAAAEAAAAQMELDLQPNWLLQLPKHLERQFFKESSVQRCDCPFDPSRVLARFPVCCLRQNGQVCCTIGGSCTCMPSSLQHTGCICRVYVMFDMLAILQAVLFNWWLLRKLGMVGSQVSGCASSVECAGMLSAPCPQYIALPTVEYRQGLGWASNCTAMRPTHKTLPWSRCLVMWRDCPLASRH